MYLRKNMVKDCPARTVVLACPRSPNCLARTMELSRKDCGLCSRSPNCLARTMELSRKDWPPLSNHCIWQ